MRQGQVFKRCKQCASRVLGRKCARCGSDRNSWTYVVDTAPTGGARKQKKQGGFSSKSLALAAMAELQIQHAEGSYVEPTKVTVGDYLTEWLARCGQIRATTRKNYDVAVRVHINPRIGEVPLQKLDKSTVKALYQELASTGYVKGKGSPKGLSPKSVNLVHLVLSKALSDGLEDGVLKANVAARAHHLDTEAGPEMLVWSAKELRQFLEAVDQDPHRVLWRVAALTGMRRGELLGLRWGDVDLAQGRLSVRQQLIRSGDFVSFGPPKTKAGKRQITIDPATTFALKSLKARQGADRLLLGEGYENHDLVFCRPDGHPNDPDTISHQFVLASRRANLKRIRFHDLRHTHATLLLQENVHPKVVQERLGHSNIMVTMNTYSHVLPNMQDEAAAKIGAVVDGI